MSDMKCPFCQRKLKPQTMDGEWLECWNCSYHEPSHHPFPQRILCGTKELWQELIRTRKALDVAVDALKRIDKTRSVANHKIGTQNKTLNSGIVFCWTTPDEIHNALEQITVLEQKDGK